MALRSRRIKYFHESGWLVGSGGLTIWVSTTSSQKSSIGWPQQPPTEKLSDISKKLDFWWFIPQKGTIIGHLGARYDPTIRISIYFWWNEAVEVIEAIEVVEAVEVIEAAGVIRPRKSQLGTSESSRFLNSALFWCFEKIFFGGRIMKCQVEF